MILIESKTSQYRAYVNLDSNPQATRKWRYLSDDGDINELSDWVDNEVDAGRAVGGDIEMWVAGFGWVVYND